MHFFNNLPQRLGRPEKNNPQYRCPAEPGLGRGNDFKTWEVKKMNLIETSQAIQQGNVSLGIELGSTRIKAVLVTDDFETIASGG
ncbi:ATPase, partial [Heyndrickxia faecalis]